MRTRLVQAGDAARLATLMQANQALFGSLMTCDEDEFTLGGQRNAVQRALAGHADGTQLPHVIVDGDRIIGWSCLYGIARGSLQRGEIGFWLDARATGRGHATAAVLEMCEIAFGRLDLHRIDAGTLIENAPSQRVLDRSGFTQIGRAPEYVMIAGAWRDVLLYQKLR